MWNGVCRRLRYQRATGSMFRHNYKSEFILVDKNIGRLMKELGCNNWTLATTTPPIFSEMCVSNYYKS